MSLHQSRLKIVIIADDLTGALDAAAAFCSTHTHVLVAVDLAAFEQALASEADVVAVSTQSREISPADAYTRVKWVVKQCTNCIIFKKIDSRLKGNIASELDALPNQPLLVAPALPSFGRYVASSHVCGLGVDSPIDIKAILGTHASTALIPDCREDHHLDTALADISEKTILVGARGLAYALAKKMGITNTTPAPLSASTAVVIGSTDPITLHQVESLPATLVQHLAAPSGVYNGTPLRTKIPVLQATTGTKMSPAAVGVNLALSFKPIVQQYNNFIVSGGATAEAVLSALDIKVLTLEGELLPGIPVAHTPCWRIVTKSGGFGHPSALLDIIGSKYTDSGEL